MKLRRWSAPKKRPGKWWGVELVNQYSDGLCKNPGPKDPALVIPRGDLVSWNLNGLWSIGVMECWSGGRTI